MGGRLSPEEFQVPSINRGCSGQLLCNYSPMEKRRKKKSVFGSHGAGQRLSRVHQGT